MDDPLLLSFHCFGGTKCLYIYYNVTVDFRCFVYIGNLWFVQPIYCNVQTHLKSTVPCCILLYLTTIPPEKNPFPCSTGYHLANPNIIMYDNSHALDSRQLWTRGLCKTSHNTQQKPTWTNQHCWNNKYKHLQWRRNGGRGVISGGTPLIFGFPNILPIGSNNVLC